MGAWSGRLLLELEAKVHVGVVAHRHALVEVRACACRVATDVAVSQHLPEVQHLNMLFRSEHARLCACFALRSEREIAREPKERRERGGAT